MPRTLSIKLCSVATALLLCAGQSAAESDEKILKIVIMADLFTDVSLDDAHVALEIWSRNITELFGTGYVGESDIFDDLSVALKAIENDEIDLFGLTSVDYLRIRERIFWSRPP
tara:strand:- start:83 stop:424 length:342 start_codon:yes stop_codon:yes gene_type:complete